MKAKVRYTTMPDFGGAYGWINRNPDDETDYLGPNHACSSGGWSGDHPISNELEHNFTQWQLIFEHGPVKHQDLNTCIDWVSFHKRGLELTQRLKAELGDDVDVFYRKPIEDPNFRLNRQFRILANGALEESPVLNDQQFFGTKLPTWFPRLIVSGGQTGADRGALEFAFESGVPHGGWCPKGRLACDGPIPAKFQLRETESSGYRQRTKLNVQNSDATLIVNSGLLEGGTALTLEFTGKLSKPCLIVQVDELTEVANAEKVSEWLKTNCIKTLNVAGPREEKRPSIFEQTRSLLWVVSKTGDGGSKNY